MNRQVCPLLVLVHFYYICPLQIKQNQGILVEFLFKDCFPVTDFFLKWFNISTLLLLIHVSKPVTVENSIYKVWGVKSLPTKNMTNLCSHVTLFLLLFERIRVVHTKSILHTAGKASCRETPRSNSRNHKMNTRLIHCCCHTMWFS